MRVEAVKQITEIGTQYSLDPLIQATRDNDPEVQIRATDGLVNFYLPGYVKTGFGASLKRVGNQHQGQVHRYQRPGDRPLHRTVRPEVIAALGKLVRSGGSMDARANAARAMGILRGKAAVPDLIEALHSKDSEVIYESLTRCRRSATSPPRRVSASCCTISIRKCRSRPSRPPACC